MTAFYDDILAQPGALRAVLRDLSGPRHAELRRGAQMIEDSERIVVSSMGSQHFAGIPLYYALREVHPCVHLEETAELQRSHPFLSRTLHIVISRSGESGEVAAYSGEIREGGGRLIAITMTPDSTLAKNADLVIHDIATYDEFICTKAFTSLTLAGLLLACVASGALDERLKETLERRFAELESGIEPVRRRLESVEALRTCPMPWYLSHGVGMAAAHVGSLYLQEGARLPAGVDSIGMFHHGPLERVDDSFAAFWIDLDPHDRSRRLFEKTAKQNATLVPVSLTAGPYENGFLFDWGEVPVPFRVLPATLVTQLYAWWRAGVEGHVAGEMKNLSWLVK
jgi:fructoselysine-6-P-deglycase FrlB-like protein